MSEHELSQDERAHDVLAAEEFEMPTPDPELHHGPVVLPEDPTGIDEAHDVLAAEEFALPVHSPGVKTSLATRARESHPAVRAAAGLALLWVAARLLRRV